MSNRIDGPRASVPPRESSVHAKDAPAVDQARIIDDAPVERLSRPLSSFTADAQRVQALKVTHAPLGDTAADAVGGPTALVRNDLQSKPDPKVHTLQERLNEWRKAHGKPEIKVDGYFGPKTEAAVKEFQKANGLPANGRATGVTQERISVENDASFQKLNDATKELVRKQMNGAGEKYGPVHNLATLATSDGFAQLSAAHQKQMVDTVSAHGNDEHLATTLASLANDANYRHLPDATKSLVISHAEKCSGDDAALDNLASVSTAASFDHLSATHQKQMLDVLAAHPDDAELAKGLTKLASSPEFAKASDASKTAAIDALAAGGPGTAGKVDAVNGLLSSQEFTKLSDAEKALVTGGLKDAKVPADYCKAVKALVSDPKYAKLSEAEKTAVLSQVKNYPDARSINNIDRALSKDWFTKQDLADKQRSLKTIGYLSQYDGGDRAVVDNTLEKFLGAKSNYNLVWKTYPSTPGSVTFGEGDGNTLWLNRGIIPNDNKKLVETSNVKHLVLATVPHEVSHLINGDKVAKTYKYFEEEYRAWYVGFKAEHGRVPTNQEAMEQRISWQLDPASFYGKYATEALKDPKEAKKFYALLSAMSGQKVDASNFATVVASDPATWSTKAGNAPVPSGNVDNH